MNNRRHAVVLGGSMAGLLAARTLSDHFAQVTIIEKDLYPAFGENRRGVPQGRHTHGLLASGREVLERQFPGITATLIGRGAVTGDIARDARWINEGACLKRFTSGLEGVFASRPFIESAVRERVLALPNVEARLACEVRGLLTTDRGARVIGICTADGELNADLVVDATGRASRMPQWLHDLGYMRPREDRVEIALAYTTRLFRRRPTDAGGDLAILISPTPESKRGGVMIAQEHDRWTVTLTGHFGNAAPTDMPGFLEYARTLPVADIYHALQDAEPLGPAAVARYPASQRRRYELLHRFPAGLLVFGDAISSFNPVYGQGMSVAALESLELGRVLASGTGNIARAFFRAAAKVIDIPWSIAAGNDLRMPEAVGPRSTTGNFINWYMSKLQRAAHVDEVPAIAFHQVANLLAPPQSVMAPRVAWRVLRHSLRPSPSLPWAPPLAPDRPLPARYTSGTQR